MNKKQIVQTENYSELIVRAAKEFVNASKKAISKKGYFTVALSGGSTPKGLYSLLSDKTAPYRDQVLWDKVHIFWGDERCVPSHHADSNYLMVKNCLLALVPIPKDQIHPIIVDHKNAKEAALEYENLLNFFFEAHNGSIPHFDLILLGMGDDGHTASLFPESSALNRMSRLVVENFVEKFKSYRITFTPLLINNASLIIFLVSGKLKAPSLKEVIEGARDPLRLPSQMIQPEIGKLLWVIDNEAGSLLDKSSSEKL